MEMVPDDKARGLKTPIWDDYKKLMNDSEGKEVSSCVNIIASSKLAS